ncbi:hypothetical protein E2562_028103 [Oryza meyeriana var. granulata]|uniref:Uncharacterized protein n=1 Tax=Oryza meyeriana var. granulata TaxID=110450 RepID=A0A6G1C806_9ORYZ|nr:hypothetical protein E2562_028103 [Oryza meyeriana var. granulata]
MAELAAGAVNSLLGLLRNEALRLGRVGSDVQFIKEEMESMNSFLKHLARTAPPTGAHDEQVMTWMKQVRELANDCSNFFDLYLQRRDPEVHRAKGKLRHYVQWFPWFVRMVVAQHNAATQLSKLKDRARDVGERRMRYGVEVPAKAAARLSPSFPGTADAPSMPSLSSSSQPAATANREHEVADDDYEYDVDDDHDDDVQYQVVADGSGLRRRALEPLSLEDYYAKKLDDWFKQQGIIQTGEPIPCIAIVAPEAENAGAIAREALSLVSTDFERQVWINLRVVQKPWDLPLLPMEVLCHILYEFKQLALENREADEKKIRQDGYSLRRDVYSKIRDKVGKINIDKKITELREKLEEVSKNVQDESKKINLLDEPLGVLYQALQLMDHTKLSSEKDTAKMLKSHMESDDSPIRLGITQYQDILLKVFPARKPQQAQDQEATTATSTRALGEDQIKEIIVKIIPGIILDMLPEPQLPQANSLSTGSADQTANNAPAAAAEIKEEPKQNAAAATDIEEPQENAAAAVAKIEEVAAAEIEGTKENAVAAEIEGTKENAAASVIKEIKENVAVVIKETKDNAASVINEIKENVAAVIKETKDNVASVIKEIKENSDAVIKETKENAAGVVIKKIKENAASVAAAMMNETMEKDAALADMIKETKQKMWKLSSEIRDQLYIQGIVDKINDEHHLANTKTLIILQDDKDYLSRKSEEIKNALSFLRCTAGSAVIVTTMNSETAKKFCYPAKQGPITCSLVGLYHDSVLQVTSQQVKEGVYSSQIIRDILDECGTDGFCMKIFLHALYANPSRSSKELHKLHGALRVSEKSLAANYRAKRMFKFSYNDLPREYKTCLLYLAIFPRGYNIRRSIIIGRWVAEGLITKEDWPTEVRHANRCFDALIDRWLVLPSDIGAAGRVKSCMVDNQVHEIITKIAKKQHIVETRLSLNLARHFNIFSNLRLRSSDKIDYFVRNIFKFTTYLPLIKVLDLEGCKCFGKNHTYLRDICNNILLLKYLSLRRTDVTHLPSEINNLHELEVLDIRQTCVIPSHTKHVLLLKMKRLLAGCTDSSPSSSDDISKATIISSVRVPKKIEKMEHMEVLTNVHASKSGYELKNIGKLWQLRKLGVVIDDGCEDHFHHLLRAISDRIDCLQSVSITISGTRIGITSSDEAVSLLTPKEEIKKRLEHPTKLLESLSIKGTTKRVLLLPLLAKGGNKLAKVTLSSTLLDNLKDLAKLPKLQCLRLRCKAYSRATLTFEENEFPALKYFIVEDQNMTEIIFDDKAVPELEKIVLSRTNINSISGVGKLQSLKEIELKGDKWRSQEDPRASESKVPDGSGGSGALVPDGSGSSGAPALDGIDKFILSLFGDASKISKVTLHTTWLTKGELQILAKKPNMRCLVLLENSYKESQLTFDKQDFPNLGLLTVDCPNITSISFNGGARKLEKIVWSFTKMESLIGIKNLPRLKELEFNDDHLPDQAKEDIERASIVAKCNKKEQNHDQGYLREPEEDDDLRFPTCSWLSKSKYCIGNAN